MTSPDESALLIPSLDLTPLVEGYRRRYDPNSRVGVPPHITVLYPFLDPDQLTPPVLAELDRLLAKTQPFDYSLTEVGEFDEGVLYLVVEPAQAFISMTELVSRCFGVTPFRGAHPTVVPHLTVAQSATTAERSRIAARLKRALPRSGRASEAWLMVGHTERGWRKERSIQLGR